MTIDTSREAVEALPVALEIEEAFREGYRTRASEGDDIVFLGVERRWQESRAHKVSTNPAPLDRAEKAEAELATLKAERERLRETLKGIDVYISDTLSGRVAPDPATLKQWLVEGLREVRIRARAALGDA